MNTEETAAPLLRGLAAATLLSLVLAGPAQAGDKDLATSQKKAPKPAVSAQTKLKADVKLQDPKDGPDQKKDVNEEAPGGPQPSLPGLSRDDRSGVKTSSGSKSSDPAQALKDAGNIRDGSANTLLINETADKASQRPKFDNGFGERPQIDDKAVSDAAISAGARNPVKGLTGGSMGGPLGEAAAASDSRSRGIDKGAIADGEGLTSPTGSFQDGELKNRGKGTLAKDLGLNERRVTGLVMGGKRFEEIDAISKGETPGAGKPAGGGDEAKPPKDDKLICHNDACSHSATVHPDGSVDVRKPDGTRETIQPDGSSVTHDKDGKVIDQQEAAGRPDPDKDHGNVSKEEFLRQKLGDKNFQIKEAAKAGGTVNPDRGETGSGVARSGAVPSQQSMGHSLFGQPVGSGIRESGSVSGPKFNGSLGAVDPGPDETVNTGPGREQDRVGDTLGRVGSQTDLNGGRSADEGDDDDSDDTQSSKDK
ncbi:hypothetical protein E4T66_12365 [Sinimarinibacterium sp. CAU 1509]|uniref:T-complex 10 C-terminal domain-containing protein n=1 Tax=Sinimarinibacterium sp. CAU 1509 TaxID=2562283 RepID=UPI0010ABAA47|nr:T-complex 10 C-terminal domain-containing protein [Sinimarinibacterium sp. CAU 1509]TJY59969.1 hypothetical protein E4T66_12365 [Sinimarinibacterium sp. CAU 1509]